MGQGPLAGAAYVMATVTAEPSHHSAATVTMAVAGSRAGERVAGAPGHHRAGGQEPA